MDFQRLTPTQELTKNQKRNKERRIEDYRKDENEKRRKEESKRRKIERKDGLYSSHELFTIQSVSLIGITMTHVTQNELTRFCLTL